MNIQRVRGLGYKGMQYIKYTQVTRKKAPHGPNRKMLERQIIILGLVQTRKVITNKSTPAMGPTVGPIPSNPSSCSIPNILTTHHCQGFSHLLTSTRLMIIAKEETTHNTQANERVSQRINHHIRHSTYHFTSKHTQQTLTCEVSIHIEP